MGIPHPLDPYYEPANWERKVCGQLKGSKGQVVEEEEELEEQVVKEVLQAQAELAVGALVQVAIILKLAFVY